MNFLRSNTVVALGLCLIFTISNWAYAAPQENSPQVLTGNWFYHWGDLPKDPDSGEWLYEQNEWKITDSPEDIPGTKEGNIVWLKIDLPSANWRDPYLFISSVDLTTQVFHKNQKIYHFGEQILLGSANLTSSGMNLLEQGGNIEFSNIFTTSSINIFSTFPN